MPFQLLQVPVVGRLIFFPCRYYPEFTIPKKWKLHQVFNVIFQRHFLHWENTFSDSAGTIYTGFYWLNFHWKCHSVLPPGIWLESDVWENIQDSKKLYLDCTELFWCQVWKVKMREVIQNNHKKEIFWARIFALLPSFFRRI